MELFISKPMFANFFHHNQNALDDLYNMRHLGALIEMDTRALAPEQLAQFVLSSKKKSLEVEDEMGNVNDLKWENFSEPW